MNSFLLFVLNAASDIVGEFFTSLKGIIDLGFILFKEGSDEDLVDLSGTSGFRIIQVDIENKLGEVVKGDKGEENSEDVVKEHADDEDNPVSEPLGIIGFLSSF